MAWDLKGSCRILKPCLSCGNVLNRAVVVSRVNIGFGFLNRVSQVRILPRAPPKVKSRGHFWTADGSTLSFEPRKPRENPRANRKPGAMAPIRKVSRTGRGDGRRMAYEVRYRDPARRERSRTFARRVDAERFVATIETDVARGQIHRPGLRKGDLRRVLTGMACDNGSSQAKDSRWLRESSSDALVA
jgi:hypothetical protein